ncbi:hypothetical protein GIB67_041958 [Kingdonia uniflora]|uniref:BRF2-like C-terminal domain-containing protein n=1 Tax=Kingdonia uniflora TaxID=39325 RepID=A0A7J7NZM4_9MAGN|nr:hypothetical protein GIB67_041958 [Kingdonia uniflora]
MGYQPCKKCRRNEVIQDVIWGRLVCEYCGVEQNSDDLELQHDYGTINGSKGNYVHINGGGSGESYSEFNYKETKIYHAKKKIEDITNTLEITAASTINEVTVMIEEITEGEFGLGNWFSVLVAACSYAVMRKKGSPISMARAAWGTGCDLHVLGQMVKRVIDYQHLSLPEFDVVYMFECAIKSCPSLVPIFSNEDKKDMMIEQGRFLLQCAIKWFLTTGRQPLPVVVAVLVFIGELNSVDIGIEEIAKELHAGIATCKKRHKELKETLVKAARILPWGENVTVKNIVSNAPFVIQYMKMQSMSKEGEERKSLETAKSDLKAMISDLEHESQYMEVENRNGVPTASFDELEKLKISQECMSKIYTSFSHENAFVKSINNRRYGHRRKRGIDIWKNEDEGCFTNTTSEMSLKLSFEEILEKNVGFDNLPPSFVAGELACKRRRDKISAAKLRINEIMQPKKNKRGFAERLQVREQTVEGAKGGKIDREDFVIELLLLHQVKEEEIEKGYYKTLLDLHVFNSGSVCEMFRPRKRRK